MKHYSFDDIEIGQIENFDIEITQEKMNLFAEISGDLNPMHVDYKYALDKGYKGILVYGMLSSLYYSTLVGMYLPGEKCLLNKCAVDYKRPVYIGDKLTVNARVVDKRAGARRIKICGQMINQEGVIVNTADIVVSFTSSNMKKTYLILGASSDLGIGLIKRIIEENQRNDMVIVAHYNSNSQVLNKICEEYGDIDIRLVQADLSCMAETKHFIDVVDSWDIVPTHIISLCANRFRYNRLSAWDYDVVLKGWLPQSHWL